MKIIKIEERSENKKMIKAIYVESKNKKDKCPLYHEYTSSIHDKLKPIEIKYLKVIEQETKVNITRIITLWLFFSIIIAINY